MRLRDLPMDPDELARANAARTRLLRRLGFRVERRLRVGRRYLMDAGRVGRRRAIFKMSLFTRTRHRETYEKLSREIHFLNFLRRSRYQHLRAAAPAIYDSGLGTRPWYLREYVLGTPQNVAGGVVRVRPSFFTEANLRWFAVTIGELQAIRPDELSRDFRRLLYRPFTLGRLLGFLRPHGRTVDRRLRRRGAMAAAERVLRDSRAVFDRAPRRLGHQEIYGPHLIIHGRRRRLFDWENIGWSVITNDPVTLWLRAHTRRPWQDRLYRTFARQHRTYGRLPELWTTTALVQALFNLVNLPLVGNPADVRGLDRASERLVRDVLAGRRVVPA